MATLRETLKELYDEFVEENRTPPVTRLASLSISQNEAAQLYAAAVARASGASAMPQASALPQASTMPPASKPMASRLVAVPASPSTLPSDTPASAHAAKGATKPDILHVLSNLTPDQVVQGIVLSEILGKPVSRRNGSNRIGR